MMNSKASFSSLLEIYNQTRQELSEAEKSIQKITARHPDGQQNVAYLSGRNSKFRPGINSVSENVYALKKRNVFNKVIGKIVNKEHESEESGSDEPPAKKPSVPSSIVAKEKLAKSRKKTIEEQNINARIKARNRRMFGSLIGTLEKFQNEEKKRQPVESKRAKIDQKVEAATEEEKERFRQEKKNLLMTRQIKKAQLRCLEKKIERTESHEAYFKNYEYLCSFIRTRVKPQLFFLPATHTAATKKRLADSQRKIKEALEKMKVDFENDLNEIEDSYKRDEMNIQASNELSVPEIPHFDKNDETSNNQCCLDDKKKDISDQQLNELENTSVMKDTNIAENNGDVDNMECFKENEQDNVNEDKNSERNACSPEDQEVTTVIIKQDITETNLNKNVDVSNEKLIGEHSSTNNESQIDGQQNTITVVEQDGDENGGKKLSELYIDYFEPIYD